jgi:glycerol-3-phosphate acyltransferase PlsY
VTAAALVALAVLAGSVPFGLLLARRFSGVDVRTKGSGNIGATNVARTAGKGLGALVLLLDAAKGALPALAARWLFPGAGWLHVAVGLAAVLGHVFCPWLGFRGGKGVATALGVFGALAPAQVAFGAAAFALALAAARVVAVASILGVAAATLAALLGLGAHPYSAGLAATFLLVVWTHRSNLARLRGGANAP